MGNPYQDALAESIDYLIKNRVDKLDRDKTITATIITCLNSLTQEYKVEYNNGMFTAYAPEGSSYRQNQMVYVLVPEGDFTKKKIIIGAASTTAGDNNITFVSSLLNDYNTIGDNVIEDRNNIYPLGLHSYLKTDYQLFYSKQLTTEAPDEKQLYIDIDKFNNYLKEAEALLIEASFQTRLPKSHRVAKKGRYGISFVLAFQNQDQPDSRDPDVIKYVTYTLDSNNMTGNPFLYERLTDQYVIYPIDAKNFLWVESILAFSEGFVDESDYKQDELWGADIFVRDLEMYGLRKIDSSNGDYRLKVVTPKGATFKTVTPSESLVAYGQTTYQINEEISDKTTYYWFIQDDRVNATSEYWHAYGGAGWKYLKDKGNSKEIITTGVENRAYENKYLCVAVYKDSVILKDYFTLYNEASKRDITITSDLGLKFSFDRGKPVLTCLVDGKSSNFSDTRPDEFHSFAWSKKNNDGSITLFNESLDDLKEQYNKGLEEGIGYSALTNLSNKIRDMEGVDVNKNVLKYPVKNIDISATFSCSLYLKDTADEDFYYAGSADITLVNEGAAVPNEYYILIENGEQVFQYSESGVSPASERYSDPLEILPLKCHFFDPAGLEVNPETYSVTWKVPLESTLIVTPKEGMIVNPATQLQEYYPYPDYLLEIEENFDYQALLNQLTCIVTYDGVEYTRMTELSFIKVGDNGTNGTDFVTKINEVDAKLNNEPLTLQKDSAGNYNFNTGQTASSAVLKFELFNRGTLVSALEQSSVTWSVQGGASYTRNLEVSPLEDGARVIWNQNKEIKVSSPKTNLIIKGGVSWESQRHYAFYPLPVVTYPDINSIVNRVRFDKQYLLKQVLYNADGRNPLFNKNQGIVFTIDGGGGTSVILSTLGGADDNSDTAPFKLAVDRDDDKGSSIVTVTPDGSGKYICYVIPDLICSGEFSNNVVHGEVSGLNISFDVPIQFMLNTVGLASLNKWDGNHIEINEDNNYILAPQIGAGKKTDDNRFTGIVMGQAKTYDGKEYKGEGESIGLLGYANGQQSIWLDAETGNATFGLQELNPQTGNPYTEGRIELRPGGQSRIGRWRIGSRNLFNMHKDDKETEPGRPYTGYRVKNSEMAVPHDSEGVLLSADPAYISVKGRRLYQNDGIDFDAANCRISPGDTFEIELNPDSMSSFTIFRHYIKSGTTWDRYPVVGINNKGQFYANALEHEENAMGIGLIGAFGQNASAGVYRGQEFLHDGNTAFKFFIPVQGENVLYISGGSRISNEYSKEISLHGKKISLMTSLNSTSPETNDKITIDPQGFFLGRVGDSGTYIDFHTSGSSKLQVSSSYTEEYKSTFTSNVASTFTQTIKGSMTTTVNQGITLNGDSSLNAHIKGTVNVDGFTSLSMTQSGSSGKFTIASSGAVTVGNNENNFAFAAETNKSTLTVHGLDVNAAQAGSGVKFNVQSSSGFVVDSSACHFSLVPGQQQGQFNLRAGNAQVYSDFDTSKNQNVVRISPWLVAGNIFATNLEANDFKANGNTELCGDTKIASIGGKLTVGAGGMTVQGGATFEKNLQVNGDITTSANVRTPSADLNVLNTDARNHIGDKNNPHQITCDTIGAQPKGNYALKSDIPDTSGFATSSALEQLRQGVIDHGATINNLADRVRALERKVG